MSKSSILDPSKAPRNGATHKRSSGQMSALLAALQAASEGDFSVRLSGDPAGVEGSEEKKKLAFVQVASQIARRIDLLCALPPEKLLPDEVRRIGTQFPIAGEESMKR